MRSWRTLRVLPFAALAVLAQPAVASAQAPPVPGTVGVGVTAAALAPAAAVRPGSETALPALTVAATGSKAIVVHVGVHRFNKGPRRTAPTAWLHVPSDPLTIQPGGQVRLPVSLSIPADATPGEYITDLVAVGQDPLAVGQLRANAAAATEVRFTVAKAPTSALDQTATRIALAIAGALAAIAVLIFVVLTRRTRST
jgi:hypothetical protein